MEYVRKAEELMMEKHNVENNVENITIKQDSHNTSNMRKLSTNKVTVSDHSFEFNANKSKNEGLPSVVCEYAKTAVRENKFNDLNDFDESLPSEKLSSKNVFRSLTSKSPLRRSPKS